MFMFNGGVGKRPATAEDELLQKSVNRAALTHDDMQALRALFQKKDSDKSGTLDIEEFYALFSAKKSPFGDALFRLVDVGGDGDFLSFSEFVEVITTYCLFSASEILQFAFKVVDTDGSGYCSLAELDTLATFLHKDGPANLNTALARIQAKYDKGDGELSFESFVRIHREFPFLLHPAFELQEYMMDCVLGRRWWNKKKRVIENSEQKTKIEMIVRLSLISRHNLLFFDVNRSWDSSPRVERAQSRVHLTGRGEGGFSRPCSLRSSMRKTPMLRRLRGMRRGAPEAR